MYAFFVSIASILPATSMFIIFPFNRIANQNHNPTDGNIL